MNIALPEARPGTQLASLILFVFTLFHGLFNAPPALAAEPGPELHQAVNAHPISVLVTVKPLYSLVSLLLDNVTDPVLLLDQEADLHHLQLRPSQRKQLADADMIVRIGPQVESWLDNIVKTRSLTLIDAVDADGLLRLMLRQKHSEKDGPDHAHKHDTNDIDPHIWLSHSNALAISRYLALKFRQALPQYQNRIDQNLAVLTDRINTTGKQIQATLKTVTGDPGDDLKSGSVNGPGNGYVAQHDAYQYFDHAYGLHFYAAITYTDEGGSSLKHTRNLQNLIQQNHIRCLIYQHPRSALVDRLAERNHMRTVEADPTGYRLVNPEQWKQAWFLIMQSISDGFRTCLASESGN